LATLIHPSLLPQHSLVMSQYSRDPYPVLVLWIQYQPEGLPCCIYLHEGAAFRKLPFGNREGADMCSASWLLRRLVSWPCKLPNWSCRFVSWLCILASVWPLFSRVPFISSISSLFTHWVMLVSPTVYM